MDIQTQILKTVVDNLNFTSDPSKIIITLDDLKYIPELSKIISFEKIVQNKEIIFSDLHEDERLQVIYIFLQKYNFIEKFGKFHYFDYTKMKEFWPNLEYYKEIFMDKKPDFEITVSNEKHSFYLWSEIKDHDKMYIGYMFFSAFNKINESESINTKEYNFFTDINFTYGDYGLIENESKFFLKEFITFINTSYGSFFGDYSFGSNLKNYIQAKYKDQTLMKLKKDIAGFIKDISLLYNNDLKLIDLRINNIDEYSIQIIVVLEINNETIQYNITKSQ